jgi:hypothetical protein
VRIGDQIGPERNRLKQPVIDISGPEHLRHLRQPLTHRQRVAHVASRHRQTDPKRRRHLGTDRRPGIHRPVLLFATFDPA